MLVQAQTVAEDLGLRLADGNLEIKTSMKSPELTTCAPALVKKATLNGVEVPFAQ